MKKKLLMITIACLPVLYFLIVQSKMSDEVVIHWNAQGQADNFGSKYIYLILALLPAFLILISHFVQKYAGSERNVKLGGRILDLLLLFFTALSIIFIYASSNEKLVVGRLLVMMFGALFLYFGNICNKIEQNSVFGIRISYTLRNEKVWNRTRYVGGYLFVAVGLISILSALVFENQLISLLIMIISLFLTLIILVIYSGRLYRKEQGAGN